MRRHEREITDPSIIQEIFKKSIICRVAFQGQEYPYVLPMNFGYVEGVLYFHCALEGKKLDLIRLNPKVAFEITQEYKLETGEKSCEWTTNYRSLLGTGTIEMLTDVDAKIKGLDVLMQHHGKMENTYVPSLVNRLVVLKLTIAELTGKQHGY